MKISGLEYKDKSNFVLNKKTTNDRVDSFSKKMDKFFG